MILPGSTIGVIGGGQLGRMIGLAARNMGYRFITLESSIDSPAAQISDQTFISDYDDVKVLNQFAEKADVITFEFENIPSHIFDDISKIVPVHPHSSILNICQNREREKRFLSSNNYPLPPFRIVENLEQLESAVKTIGTPSVLKTADFGYDGKGQIKIDAGVDLTKIWDKLNAPKAVLESWVTYECEISVICARSHLSEAKTFPVAENIHTNHILDFSILPARVPDHVIQTAASIAISLAEDLNLIGLLAVEMFLTKDGEILINELAPRPHNSGHYSMDGCQISQFEQHVRAICGLPLASPKLHSPSVMLNLLGDLWNKGEPDWATILQTPGTSLHLYGKTDARAGRKMGHINFLSETNENALKQAKQIKQLLVEAAH